LAISPMVLALVVSHLLRQLVSYRIAVSFRLSNSMSVRTDNCAHPESLTSESSGV
jgi:hypothetical protein